MQKIRGDFNGLWGGEDGSTLLCLSHGEPVHDELGNEVILMEGLEVIVYDEDADIDGNRDDLMASGRVEASPAWLQCKGSGWALRIDENGVRHESSAAAAAAVVGATRPHMNAQRSKAPRLVRTGGRRRVWLSFQIQNPKSTLRLCRSMCGKAALFRPALFSIICGCAAGFVFPVLNGDK